MKMKNKASYTYRSLWPKSDLKPRAVDITSKFCRNLALVQKVLESGDTDRISRIFLNRPHVKDLFRRPTYTDDRPQADTSKSATTDKDNTTTSDETEPSDGNSSVPATDVPATDGGQTDTCDTDSPAAEADTLTESHGYTEPSEATANIDSTSETEAADISEATVNSGIAAETGAVDIPEATVNSDIAAETEAADIPEATVNSDIAAETEAADIPESTVNNDIAAETEAADIPEATVNSDIAVETDHARDETIPVDQQNNNHEDAIVATDDCIVETTTSPPPTDAFPDDDGLTDVGNVSIFVDHGYISNGTPATTETTIADDVAVTLASPETTAEDGLVPFEVAVASPDNVVGDERDIPVASPDTVVGNQAALEEMTAASPDVMNEDETSDTEPSFPASPEAAAIAELNREVPAFNEMHNYEIDVLHNEYGQLQKLGKGFYGMVYLVKCKYTGEVLVCKELCAELSTMEDMEMEAKLLRLLRPTGAVPYFVGVIKNVRHTGNYGIIQGQVPDVVTLEDLLSGKYHLDKLRLILIALNLVDAVRKVHELGVIHNDIKPDNILVQKSSAKVRLIDFGLASYKVGISCDIAPGEESRFQHVAPEVYHSKSSFGSDMFSLGFVLKAMLGRVGDTTLDRLVQMCREADMDDRPSLEYITQRLTTVKDKWVLERLKERHALK